MSYRFIIIVWQQRPWPHDHILSLCFLPPLCRAVWDTWGEEGGISMVAEARVWSRQTMWVLTFHPLTTVSTIPSTRPAHVTQSQHSADNSTAAKLYKTQLQSHVLNVFAQRGVGTPFPKTNSLQSKKSSETIKKSFFCWVSIECD